MIRHLTQRTNTLANDCSQACSAMLVNAYLGLNLSVESLAKATGTNTGRFVPFSSYTKPNGTRVVGLNDIFAHYKLAMTHTQKATLAWYRETLGRGIPVLALVDYSAYSDNPLRYEYAHFLLVVSMTDTTARVMDPLRTEGPTDIPLREFAKSINQQSAYIARYDANGKPVKGYNYSNQAMYPLAPLIAPVPDKTTVLLQVRSFFEQIRAAA
jgi:ABC-type bacteriocin/lantibiotic exporter with double-glycine peptidase domain